QSGSRRWHDPAAGREISVEHGQGVRGGFHQPADCESRHRDCCVLRRYGASSAVLVLAQYVIESQAGLRRSEVPERWVIVLFRPQQSFIGVTEKRNNGVTADDDDVLEGIPGARAIGNVLDRAGNQIFRERTIWLPA